MTIQQSPFGNTQDGQEVDLYELKNTNGMKVGLLTYGGIITSIEVPDKNGRLGDVVLGHENMTGYQEKNDYFGCIAGRYANRIGKGRFYLDGVTYQLPQNNNGNSLHGGLLGFDQKVWEAEPFESDTEVGVQLKYWSKDGEEGYPGNLHCTVTYTLGASNELRIDYEATTDKATVINLTNHSYFNLKDGGVSSVLDHQLKINASTITPVDSGLIPTGELLRVSNTPFDFTEFHSIGGRINDDHPQLGLGLGYDHNYVLDRNGEALFTAAILKETESGRILEVLTTEPGIQFYSGNFLKGDIVGKGNTTYQYRSAICLETQHFPDSPNQPHFPTTVLRPGEQYKSTTIFRFTTE